MTNAIEHRVLFCSYEEADHRWRRYCEERPEDYDITIFCRQATDEWVLYVCSTGYRGRWRTPKPGEG